MVRTKRPQCVPLLWRSGASSGTVTGVARMRAIVVRGIVRVPAWVHAGRLRAGTSEGDGLYAAGRRRCLRRQRSASSLRPNASSRNWNAARNAAFACASR